MSTGLQTIIDNCNGIKFNRRNVVGIQYTRNEIPRVSATPTRNPWKITIDMPNRFRYNQIRALLEELDTLDTTTPQVVTFGNLTAMDWIFKYQGALSTGNLAGITVQTYVGNQLTLTGLPAVASTTIMFKKNDLIQINNHPYPFTTENDVLRGTGSTVVITTSRPNIISSSVVGLGITVGSTCEFNMFCPNMPVYKLTPGGYVGYGGATTNNALIEWSDSFFLYEFVGDA
jgi:hypothetical protein